MLIKLYLQNQVSNQIWPLEPLLQKGTNKPATIQQGVEKRLRAIQSPLATTVCRESERVLGFSGRKGRKEW